jgi:hypothetical protein
VINHIAHAALAGHDVAHADRLARDALACFNEHGERQGIAEVLDTMAAVAAARSDGDRAATIAGAAAAVRETIASQPAPFDVAITGPVLQRIRASVTEEQWHRCWSQGQSLELAAAVTYALVNAV